MMKKLDSIAVPDALSTGTRLARVGSLHAQITVHIHHHIVALNLDRMNLQAIQCHLVSRGCSGTFQCLAQQFIALK